MSDAARTDTTLDGRTAAARALTDALDGTQFVCDALRSLRAAGSLSGREAGLAMEIGQGAARHLVTIEHVLSHVAKYEPRRTKPILRAILYCAAYQIIWMDRIPTFAAVDESVRLARKLAGGRSPGMVNAILRRLTGAIVEPRGAWQRLNPQHVRVSWEQACHFKLPVLPAPGDDDPSEHLAVAAGERPQRYTQLCRRYGAARTESIAWASQAVPVTVLQRNTQRATAEAFQTYLRTACGNVVSFARGAAFVPAGVAVFDSPAFQDGLVYVQDMTAHRAALAIAARPGQRVLDLCAAPGGKTVTLALAMQNRGAVIACDTAADRLKLVDANVLRLGLDCVHTRLLSPEQDHIDAGSQPLDAAIVDVPCSNSGVIARRPEARLGLTARKLGSLIEVQRELLRKAAEPVRPGGCVVYSTCSIEPAENEEVVAYFAVANPEWSLVEEETTLPAWGPALSDWRDGGYFARLQRAV